MAPAFLVLAVGLWFSSQDYEPPGAPTPVFEASLIEPGALRRPLGDPPKALISGFEQRCNSCHDLFESTWDGARPLQQHTHIALSHGINNDCANC